MFSQPFVLCHRYYVLSFFFFKQKTAYELRISDWSSDVCSSDLQIVQRRTARAAVRRRGGLSPIYGAGRERRRIYLDRAARRDAPARLRERELAEGRSEERRVGKECVSTGRSRWSRYH